MTSIEWLEKELDFLSNYMSEKDRVWLFNKAKEMHKQEIIDAVGVGSQFDRNYLYGYHDKAEQYYQETFVSNFKQFSLYEHKETITSADTQVSKTFLESVPKQETLYTERQVDKAISWGINSGRKGDVTITDIDNFIQSLKQPKKD